MLPLGRAYPPADRPNWPCPRGVVLFFGPDTPETGACPAPRPAAGETWDGLFSVKPALPGGFDNKSTPAPTRRQGGQQVGRSPAFRYLAASTGRETGNLTGRSSDQEEHRTLVRGGLPELHARSILRQTDGRNHDTGIRVLLQRGIEILAVRLDDVMQTLTRDKQILNSENQSKQQTLETLNDEIGRLKKVSQDTEARIAEANSEINAANEGIRSGRDELTGLHKQLSKLNEQREMVELDCDAAKKQAEELKAHIHLDAETVALLEEGDRLKHGTVSKSLEEMEREIEKTEKRIAFILKFRSKFNQIVEDAIFSGDGTILAGDEAGGITDGVGSTTPSENT